MPLLNCGDALLTIGRVSKTIPVHPEPTHLQQSTRFIPDGAVPCDWLNSTNGAISGTNGEKMECMHPTHSISGAWNLPFAIQHLTLRVQYKSNNMNTLCEKM